MVLNSKITGLQRGVSFERLHENVIGKLVDPLAARGPKSA